MRVTFDLVRKGDHMEAGLDLSDMIQIAAAGASAIAALFSYRQCKLMKEQSEIMGKQLDGDRYLKQNEHSIELARLFADEIVPQSAYITDVIRCSKTMMEVAAKVSHNETSRFDSDEYREIIGESPERTLRKFEDEILRETPLNDLIAARLQLRFTKPSESLPIPPFRAKGADKGEDAHDSEEDAVDSMDSQQAEKNQAPSLDRQIALKEFWQVSNTLLNRLEHFSMALNSEVADDEILYQSLHQIFFSIVSSLYVSICHANNGDPVDKYFTHVTDLYNRWMNRHSEEKKMLKDVEAEIHSKYEQKKKEQLR